MTVYIYEDIKADEETEFNIPLLVATVHLTTETIEANNLEELDSPEAENFLSALCNTYKTNKNDSSFWWEIE